MHSYFILAPREMSDARVKDLLKKYLPRGQVIFGIAREPFVAGFEDQPQFKTLQGDSVKKLAAKSGGRLTTLTYTQAAGAQIIAQTDFDRAIIINGSFHRSFHLRPEHQAILAKDANIKYESPFISETEAKAFASKFQRNFKLPKFSASDIHIQRILAAESKKAFITDFQTAAAIVKNDELISLAHNAVVPYETYAWHYGNQREKHRTPAGDSSHYDTIHAETAALIKAGDKSRGATLYMRTFPCPHCARNIIYAGIAEIVYELDYGDQYSYNLFNKSGTKYRRFE